MTFPTAYKALDQGRVGRAMGVVGTLSALVSVLLVGSCAGTEVGNPSDQAEVTVEFALVGPPAGALVLADGVEVDEVWLLVDDVQVRSASECSGEHEEEAGTGPLAVEIISGAELPGPAELHREPGSFCRLDMRFGTDDEERLPLGMPEQLADASVYVSGRRADGTPFVLSTRVEDDVRLDAACSPFSLDAGRHRLVIGFAIEGWLTAADLDQAAVEEGVIRIDEEHNSALLAPVEQSLSTSPRLYRDTNRDGFLNGSESEQPLTACGQP